MRCTGKRVTSGAVGSLMCAALIWSWAGAETRFGDDFQSSEIVQTLTVKIDVGGDGDALEEPLAVDLGLGFPLWLHPVGREADEPPPFGAVAQESTAGAIVPAGSSATFTFRTDGEPGNDILETTSQLLADVRVSDIHRIGFSSFAATNWTLAGYEISINGRLFAANDAVNQSAAEARAGIQSRADALAEELAPLVAEAAEIRALAEVELAEQADLDRLSDLDQQLAPLREEKQWCDGQLDGRYPWFVEPEFRSLWRGEPSVLSGKVTLLTHTHSGADTRNLVYFALGGHKFPLSSPALPLSAELGAQEFELDLRSAPLTAADMRGFAVGMLGHAVPYGHAPDRWHPQRILLEIDGRIVFDSDESPIDRMSLEAIRIIPPAHADEFGTVVKNTPNARETFLWEAGKGMGLDLVAGGPLGLPPEGDPAFPAPEPGLDAGADHDEDWVYPPFPGEWDPGHWHPGPEWPDWPGWDPGWGPEPSLLDLVFGWLFDQIPLPPGFDPPPVGDAFQVDDTAITAGWRAGDDFTVEWTVAGDASEIDHFVVELLPVRPDQDPPITAPALADMVVSAAMRDVTFPNPLGAIAPDPFLYVMPSVTAMPIDPMAATPDPDHGPARPVFPVGTAAAGQPGVLPTFRYTRPPLLILYFDSISFGGEPAGGGRAVWTFGEAATHNALRLGNPNPGYNIAVRPEIGDGSITVELNKLMLLGKRRVVADVGFLGGPDAANSVDVDLRCSLYPLVGIVPDHVYPLETVGVVNPAGGPPQPMQAISQVVDTADAGPGFRRLKIVFSVRGGAVDPDHPPALFGVRLVPEP
jgi:hypothetical protein